MPLKHPHLNHALTRLLIELLAAALMLLVVLMLELFRSH